MKNLLHTLLALLVVLFIYDFFPVLSVGTFLAVSLLYATMGVYAINWLQKKYAIFEGGCERRWPVIAAQSISLSMVLFLLPTLVDGHIVGSLNQLNVQLAYGRASYIGLSVVEVMVAAIVAGLAYTFPLLRLADFSLEP